MQRSVEDYKDKLTAAESEICKLKNKLSASSHLEEVMAASLHKVTKERDTAFEEVKSIRLDYEMRLEVQKAEHLGVVHKLKYQLLVKKNTEISETPKETLITLNANDVSSILAPISFPQDSLSTPDVDFSVYSFDNDKCYFNMT